MQNIHVTELKPSKFRKSWHGMKVLDVWLWGAQLYYMIVPATEDLKQENENWSAQNAIVIGAYTIFDTLLLTSGSRIHTQQSREQ